MKTKKKKKKKSEKHLSREASAFPDEKLIMYSCKFAALLMVGGLDRRCRRLQGWKNADQPEAA